MATQTSKFVSLVAIISKMRSPLVSVLYLCLLSVSLQSCGNLVAGSPNWLLDSSFQAKPINMIRELVSSETSLPAGVSVTCRQQLDVLLNHRPFRSSWPMQMLDSNALLPSGVMRQTFTSVGSYRQCLQVHSQYQSTPVDGQFCFLTFSISNSTAQDVTRWEKKWVEKTALVNNRFRYAFGVCVPETCSRKDLTLLFMHSGTAKSADLKNIRVGLCQSEKPQSFREKLYEYNNNIAFPVLMLTLMFAFLGTFWHLFGYDEKHWLMNFSVIKNTKAIFVGKSSPEGSLEHRLQFFHGIRFLAMFWIFCAHAGPFFPAILVMPISYATRHPYDIQNFISNGPVSALLTNGFYAVQVFFFLSGFLLTALIIEKNSANKISFAAFVSLRWIRFVVPLMGAIVLQKILFMLWKSPFFTSEVTNSVYSACHDSEWWKNFFFITNFTSKSCIRASWFLSTDLQIHIVAFVLVLALRRSSYRWVYGLSYVLASMSIVVPFVLLLLGFPTMNITSYFDNYHVEQKLKTEIKWMYFTPYMHMGAYFYGSILGTLLMRNHKLLTRLHKPLFWGSLIGMIAAAFYKEPTFESLGYSHLNRGLVNGVGFGLWNFSLGMIVFQLALPSVPGHAKWLSRFLSHPFHRPVSRLSFSIYLTQFTILILNFSLVDDVHNISLQSSVTFSLASLIETIILSWLLFVLFESPAYHFVKSLMDNSETKKEGSMNNKKDIEYTVTPGTEQEMLDIELPSKKYDAAA